MCRIAGMIARDLLPGDIHKKVSSMCQMLAHGGPDDEGIFADENAGLVFGHRRLAIIDLSNNGHQPMPDVKKRAWITFNGEIYNYTQLKQELIAEGAAFFSNTDTEVIIQAYLYWGVASFHKLRGMFAFAIYDIERAATFLVRDTNGIKPLYYHIYNSQLSFASETKALKYAGIAAQEDKTWQARLLAFGNIPEPYTTLQGVFSLPKSCFLKWDHRQAKHTITAYTSISSPTYITDKKQAEEYIREALIVAVNRQLIADAPIGVFLSGGIDSSLITLLANHQKQQQLKTISIFFDEKAYDERQYQNLIFKELSGEKFSHLVTQNDFETCLPRIIEAMDIPTTDSINSWFISNYARQDGLKAVLSGLGADEFFGGYPSFNRIKHLGYLRKLPGAAFKLANYFVADKYRKIAFLSHQHYLADYLLLRGLFVPNDIARLLDADVKEINEILFDSMPGVDLGAYNEEHAAWFESNLYMQNQLLRDTDVMSMTHGLEVRVPFLDEDLIKIIKNVSPEIRFDNKQPKKLLIDTFKDILPPAIWNRPKMGFSFPLQKWMKQNEAISNEDSYKGPLAKNMVKQFKDNRMHWSKIFAIYQVQQHG